MTFWRRKSKLVTAVDLFVRHTAAIVNKIDERLEVIAAKGESAYQYEVQPGPTRDWLVKHYKERGFGVSIYDPSDRYTSLKGSITISW